MVLSNKKLKQKLRANLAESLAESEAQNNPTSNDSTEPQHSLKSLLESAIHKPRITKREKRRDKNEEDSSILNTSGGAESNKGDDEESGAEEQKVKKKRKRDGDEKGEGFENGDSEKLKLKKINKNKKKKKKNKKKRKVGDGEVKNVMESEAGVNGEQSVEETIKKTESQEKLDASTKVYVGGIPYYSTEDDIRSFFESCGSITEIDCMKFPDSGKFRGIAIISFKTEAAAKRALELDGADMGGLFLKIQLYKATREHKPSDFSPAIIDGYNRIYIGNLSWDITEDEIRNLFSDCNISSIRFGEDKETGQFKGFAHVDFADSLSVTMALKLDQKIVCGRPARIRCAVPRKAATPASKSAPAGEKNDNRVLSSNPKRTSNVEKDDYIGSSFGSKYVEMSEKDAVEMSEKVDIGGAVSGKIRRRTCYECGGKGHLSSDCPKKPVTETIDSSEKGHFEEMSEKPVEMSEKFDNGGGVSVASGKIRRRTCYECGEKGHLSSDCPKKPVTEAIDSGEKGHFEEMSEKPVKMSEEVDNGGGVTVASGKIRRRTCYECGEKGHLSSACPKKQAA